MPRKKSASANVARTAGRRNSPAKKKGRPEKNAASGKTARALRNNEVLLKLALKSAHVGLWELDLKTSRVKWSENVNIIFGIDPESVRTLDSYLGFIHEDDRQPLLANIEKTIRTQEKFISQHRVIWPDGTVHWFEGVGKIILNRKGVPVKMTGSLQDITTIQLSVLEKEDWKIRYDLIAASAGQVVYDYDIHTGNIVWSGVVSDILGYTSDEMRDFKTWEQRIHPEDRDMAFRELEKAEKNIQPYEVNYRFRKKDGTYLHLHDKGFFMANGKGSAYRMLGVMQDISEKVKSTQAIQEINRLKEGIENAIPGLLYIFDIEKRASIFVNQNTTKLLGYTQEEFQQFGNEVVEKLVHPDDVMNFPVWGNDPDGTVKECEYRLKDKFGDWRWLHSRDTPFKRNLEGIITQVVGIAQDITEKKLSEALLREREKSYHQLFDTVDEAIYLQNVDGTFIDVNKGACDMYGYSREDFLGRTPEFLSAEGKNDLSNLQAVFTKCLNGEPQSFEWWGKKKSGEIFLKEVQLSKGSYEGRDIMIAASRDVTRQRESVGLLRESEKRFRDLIRDLNIGVTLRGPDATLLLYNKIALDLLGQTADQLRGTAAPDPEWKAIKEDGSHFPESQYPVMQALKTKQPVRDAVMGVYRPEKKDFAWLLVNAEPILKESGDIREVICTFTDITIRRKYEEQLRESEQRFRTLQRASFGGIGLHDQGMILDCNQGLCDITGYPYEELVGKNGLELIAPEFRTLVMEKIRSNYEKTYDVEGIRKDGSRFILEIQGKAIPYQGRMIRVTEFRDITERKKAEEKILEQNARLQVITDDLKRKNEQLEEFTQIVSHNLRAPVGNILTLINFLESAQTTDEKVEYIHYLKESGTLILTTLHELNDVLKIKQSKKIEKQALKFQVVFDHVRTMLIAKISEVGAEVTTDFAAAPVILYPNIYLESIFLNLLSNSLKYIYEGRKPVLHFKTYYQQEYLIMEVSDNGLGIDLDRYGHQVFKLRKTFHRHPESRGVGLFMIKNQIEAMGGEITLSSIANKGTTFYINFNKNSHDGE
jgi:PAS domain S-box-containing protein